MKKLLVALAVIASIGVTLSENNVVSSPNTNYHPNYHYWMSEGVSQQDAYTAAVNVGYYYGLSLGTISTL
jgi:hypothetical protein